MPGTVEPGRVPHDSYDGVVYDLDGTLVRLRVDWAAVAGEVEEVWESAGHDPAGRSLWDLVTEAEDPELAAEVEETVAAMEREGAERAEFLPTANELMYLDRPAGVCSLNCESACRIALDRHGLSDSVSTVVGRDTVSPPKPDPKPLRETIRRMGLDRDSVVFVGDSMRDKECARRAGVDFEFVDGRPDRP
ncbi:phosphoglycolate phosphatase [Halobacteriales archaeon QS_8_69_26]|nr:MAG: phosphoglycolate phosphatase [Halobacteriales archaeon QS_8_69_26]